MEKIADIKAFNDTFVEMVKEGKNKDAAASAQKFTRHKLREESFAEKILTPIDISNDELDKAEDAELLVKWNDREPDVAPAVTIPLGLTPDGIQFKGSRYPVYFARIVSPFFKKDIDKLRSYDYDIRGILLETSTKEIATEIDRRFIAKVDAVLGSTNTINPLNGMGEIQNVDLSVSSNPLSANPVAITRQSLVDAQKFIQKLRVPFGPLQPDGGSSKGLMLMNNITASELLKFERSEVGGDLAQTHFVEGLPSAKILGMNSIYTLKRELIPDNVVYYFSSEEFFGKYYRLQPLTVFMENKAFFLSFFQYMNIGMAIGNVRGAVKVKFADSNA